MAKKGRKMKILAYKRGYAKAMNDQRKALGLVRRRTTKGFKWGVTG